MGVQAIMATVPKEDIPANLVPASDLPDAVQPSTPEKKQGFLSFTDIPDFEISNNGRIRKIYIPYSPKNYAKNCWQAKIGNGKRMEMKIMRMKMYHKCCIQ
jgi:hypothetical protein